MDDISKQVHEDNGAHTAIHGPRRALERLRVILCASTWMVRERVHAWMVACVEAWVHGCVRMWVGACVHGWVRA